LFYQIKIKLLAERAGLISVTVESDQIVLRYPSLPAGMPARPLPEVGGGARAGRNAYWMPVNESTWREELIELLSAIIDLS
jgi:transcription-repair coupling factor (superfamily II helicase)